MWLGFLFAAIVLVLELSTGLEKVNARAPLNSNSFLPVATFVMYLAGLVYWYWSVYRIHKILKEAAEPKYPISPWKAVGYQFIPIYNLVWNFKWPNRIADFVRQNSTEVRMRKGWVGLWLLLAGFLGGINRGLGLAVFFAICAYLTRKIRRVLALRHLEPIAKSAGLATFADGFTAPDATTQVSAPREGGFQLRNVVPLSAATTRVYAPAPQVYAPTTQVSARPVTRGDWDLSMSKEWKLPVSSGIGAAFGFLMCYGIWLLRNAIVQEGYRILAAEGIKILLVGAVLYFFLEPLAELILQELRVAEEHHAEGKLWQKILRFGVFVLVIDVAHSLLERAAEKGGGFEVAEVGILLTLFFGGMTYLWISGAPKQLREALALVSSGLVLLLIFGGVVAAEAKQVGRNFSKTSITSKETLESLGRVVAGPAGAIADEHSSAEEVDKDSAADWIERIPVLCCAVFVGLAGFIAMRKNLGRVGVSAAVFAASLLSAGALSRIPHSTPDGSYIVVTLWSSFWWCFGMLAFYDHDVFQPAAQISLDPHHAARVGDPLTRPVWLVSFLILVGLIVTTFLVPPPGGALAGRVLTLIADNKERPYGVVNPELTSHPLGLENGENLESVLAGVPSLSSAAGIDSPPGAYPIAISRGTGKAKNDKYSFDFVNGSLKVVQAPTQTSLASSAARATANTPVTFTTAIAPQYWGTPSGTVSFSEGESLLGTSTLLNGRASYTASRLPVGVHVITAKYSGDTNFLPSNSSWTQQIVPSPEVPPRAPATITIPTGTPIVIATVEAIDSTTTKAYRPLMAILATPLIVDGQVLAQRGAMAVLAVTDIDPDGRLSGKPALTVHLARLDIAGKSYQVTSRLRMQNATAGRIHLSAATILTFKLESPITTDVSEDKPYSLVK